MSSISSRHPIELDAATRDAAIDRLTGALDVFEVEGVQVEYIDYQKQPYPQQHGAFTPFVSVLDLIANLGQDGARVMVSGTVDWKKFCV